jgi:hypothetical protein
MFKNHLINPKRSKGKFVVVSQCILHEITVIRESWCEQRLELHRLLLQLFQLLLQIDAALRATFHRIRLPCQEQGITVLTHSCLSYGYDIFT